MSEEKKLHEDGTECCGGKGHADNEECCGGHHHHDHFVEDADDAVDYITLTLEDGKDVECAILGTFNVDSIVEFEFMALLPKDSEEVIIFSFVVDGDQLTLDPIADEIFEEVSNEFMRLYGEENFED